MEEIQTNGNYHVRIYEQGNSFTPYGKEVCTAVKENYNSGNFLKRNVFTGLQKPADKRFPLEEEAIKTVMKGIRQQNLVNLEKFPDKLCKAFMKAEKDSFEAMLKALVKGSDMTFPTEDSPFLNYNAMDAVLKQTKNKAYQSVHKQFAQNALQKVDEAWEAWWESMKEYRSNPKKFTGRPKIPKYCKKEEMTATIAGKYLVREETEKGLYLLFPYHKVNGKKIRGRVFVGHSLPDEPIATAEIVPFHGKYRVILTFGKASGKTSRGGKKKQKAKKIQAEEKKMPQKLMGLDPGVSVFATITDNLGNKPLLIKGGYLKARNQWFNKRQAELLSLLTRGEDSKHSKKQSRKLNALRRKRDNFFRDVFYKISHRICRVAKERGIEGIIIGHTKGWKQEVSMGKVQNQHFAGIPFNRFFRILEQTAKQYGICVILQEESYTSKASFPDMDKIPVWGKEEKKPPVFSGKRTTRGQYRTKSGRILHADVNGSANIIRKYKPDAFAGRDISYLYGSIDTLTFQDLYKDKKSSLSHIR